MPIARYYDASKNEDNRLLPNGDRPGDISDEVWEAMTPYLQASIDEVPFMRKTALPKAKPAKAEPQEAPAPEPEQPTEGKE